jgi:hypothetical protein
MPIYKRISWFVSVLALAGTANASTLTFVPQLDNAPGTTNYSWFSSANWFLSDGGGNLTPAGRVPQANDSAIVTSLADAGATGVRIKSLLLTNNSAISNGTFAVENLQMLSGSSLNSSTVNILVFLNVGGTNCTLNDTELNILSMSSATLAAASPATSSTLILAQGSVLWDFGTLKLTADSQIIGGALPQSTLTILPKGVLSSTDVAYIRGSASGPLLFDNSGLVQVDDGTLRFGSGLDWQCTAGIGEFRAASTNSLIVFGSGFHADLGTLNLFTGPGTNIWSDVSSIDGTVQVGTVDPDTLAFSTGNLDILASCSGLGDLHVLGSVAQSAVLNWGNGTLSLAVVNVDPEGAVLITGENGTSRQLSGCTLNNSGVCTLQSGDLALSQGAAINNLVSATFQVLADGTFSGAPAPTGGAINNSGMFRKSSPGVTQFGTASPGQGPDFNNAGRVEIASGQLNLVGGTNSGQFQTEAGAVLWFWGGTYTLNTGAIFSGAGSVRLYQGISAPQWLLSDDVSVPELELGNNGTISGPGDLTIGNTLFWTNGIIQDSGTLNIPPGARFSILGSSIKTLLQRTINNQGNILLVDQASMACGAGATLNNLSGGTVDIQTDATITFSNAGQMLVINNAGSFVKSGGTGTSSIEASLNNSGDLGVRAGTLNFQGSWSQTQGSTIIDSGKVLGATLLSIGGGSLVGGGTIQAKVISGGITSPGSSPGILSLGSGEDYEQLASGVLRAELGGPIVGSQYDQLLVGGNASLAGILELQLINGFVPQLGDQFQILTCATQTGQFSQISAPQVSGAVWVAHYAAGKSISVVLANEVTLEQPTLSRGTIKFSFKTTPGLDYVVQQSPALSPANWQTFTTIPGDGTIHSVSDQASKGQNFYRVLIQ